MASTTEEADHVLVTLSVEHDGKEKGEYPERTFVLSRASNTMQIGRASRSSHRGFEASAKNGWFYSRVLSREHAELMADIDKRSLSIREMDKCRHGTYINDESARLGSGITRRLQDGDRIRFGTETYDEGEYFAPTAVTVHLKFSPDKNEAFKVVVPEEDSDDEDEAIKVLESLKPGVIDLTADSIRGSERPSAPPDLAGNAESAEVIQFAVSASGGAFHQSDVIDLTNQVRSEPPEGEPAARGESVLDIDLEALSDSGSDQPSFLTNEGEESNHMPDVTRSSEQTDSAVAWAADSVVSDDEFNIEEDNDLFLAMDDEFRRDQELVEAEFSAEIVQDSATIPPPLSPTVVVPTQDENLPSAANHLQIQSEADPPQVAHLSLSAMLNPEDKSPDPEEPADTSPFFANNQSSLVEVLGHKTGKAEYFAAREENLRTLGKTSCQDGAAPAALGSTALPLLTSDAVILPTASPASLTLEPPVQSPQAARAERAAIKSAHTFQLQKSGMKRTEIGIGDVVEPSQRQGQKRKADDISTLTPEERSWAMSEMLARSTPAEASKRLLPTDPGTDVLSAAPNIERNATNSRAVHVVSEPKALSRPNKLRRIAERLGFAALGGATVGAVVLGSLIYTAPSF